MKIVKVLFMEIGANDQMYLRPFQANVDGEELNHLQEVTRNGKNLTPAALSGVGADIMRPSATISNPVDVVGGLNNGRLVFMMEVEWPAQAGLVTVEYLTGYTDYVGVNATFGRNTYDPNMRLYFNNVIRGSRRRDRSGFASRSTVHVQDSHQIISGEYQPDITNLHNVPHLMRPQDVFTNVSMAECRNLISGDVYDTRSTHGPDKLQVSDRRNNIPGTYLSRLLTTWNDHSDRDHHDEATMYSSMASVVAEPSIIKLRTISKLSTMTDLRRGGSVTWGELKEADEVGMLEARTTAALALSNATRSQLSHVGQGQHWRGNDHHTIIATSVAQAVPGIMAQLLLTMAQFTATNMTLDGSWIVNMIDWESFNDDQDMVIEQVKLFQQRMITDLLLGVSAGNLMPMALTCTFDVMSQTSIEVDFDGEAVPFFAPSFCDGLFSNIRAPGTNALDDLATNIQKLMLSMHQDNSAKHTAYEPIEMGNFRNDQANHSL
jgi:hypothetical protein